MAQKEELELRRIKLVEEDGTIIGDITAVSVVSEPAIKLSAKFFTEVSAKNHNFIVTSKDKQEITGPALIPDTAILRFDEETKKYYNAMFEKSDVKTASELFLRTANHNQANFEHIQIFTDKLALVESWIVLNPEMDKAKELGFDMSKIPAGSWFMTYKVLDAELWNELKESDFQGFSVEIKGFEVPAQELSAVADVEDSEFKALIKNIVFSKEICDEMKHKLIQKILLEK